MLFQTKELSFCNHMHLHVLLQIMDVSLVSTFFKNYIFGFKVYNFQIENFKSSDAPKIVTATWQNVFGLSSAWLH